MKKIITFILLSLTLISISGCESAGESEIEYEFDTITNYSMSSSGHPEIDKNLALKIGSLVLESNFKEVEKDKMRYHIKYLKGEEMYIVLWVPQNAKSEDVRYGVAIDKKNGEILRMWSGE